MKSTCQVAWPGYPSSSKDWTYKALRSLVPSQLKHILNFKHANSHRDFNGSIYMLKVKSVLKCATGVGPEHLETRSTKVWSSRKPRPGDFSPGRQDPAAQEPAAPSSLSQVFLCTHWGGFALVTYIIHQTSGGWIRQSDVARWDDGVKKLLQLACPSLRLSVI